MSDRLLTVMDGADAEQPDPAARYRPLRLAVNLLADTAMQCDDASEAANFAIAALRSELEYRFELLWQPRQPAIIDPQPLSPWP